MLTQKQIDSIKATGQIFRKGLGNGLTLRVSKKGAKTFSLMYRLHGRQNELSFGAVQLNDAQLLAAQARAEVAKGLDPLAEKAAARAKEVTLREFLESHYFPHIHSNQRNPKETIRVFEREFGKWFKTPLPKLSLNKAMDWRDARLKDGLSVASVNKYTNYLKAATAYAYLRGIVTEDPLAKLRRLRDRRDLKIRWLTQNEERVLTETLHRRDTALWDDHSLKAVAEKVYDGEIKPIGDHLLPAVLLALKCGLRRKEVLSLRWKDIRQIGEFSGDDKWGQWELVVRPESDKTGKGRIVPLNTDEVLMLRAWQTKCTSDVYVFPNSRGEPMSEIKNSWRSLIRLASRELATLSDLTFRDLRSTFGSRLVQNNIHMLEVSKLLGHSSVVVTERHYADLADDSARRAVKTLSVYDDVVKGIRLK